jgi:hypothetical protein
MHKRFIINSPSRGVFLGSAMGMAFWTKLDPAGQEFACTFKTESDAKSYMSKWETPPPSDVVLLVIQAAEDDYASIAECVKAGADFWDIAEEQAPKTLH